MPVGRPLSVEDLLEIVRRDELEKIVARRGKVSIATFLEALHSDLDDTIGRLEAAAHHYTSDGVEKLTNFLAVQLAALGYNAICETDGHGHTYLKVENHAAKIVWIAIADLYRSCAQSIATILRLFTRTSGRHAHAGFLFYIRDSGASRIIEGWIKTLQSEHQVICHAVTRGADCVFLSDHTHPSTKFPITIRHHAILMESRHEHQPGNEPLPKKRHIILFLAADPNGVDRSSLDREAHAIHAELERSGCRDCFEFVTRWAAEPLDLLRELRKLKPTVVHFSGGQNAAVPPRRDVMVELVSTAALEATFGAAGASVKLVVLTPATTKGKPRRCWRMSAASWG